MVNNLLKPKNIELNDMDGISRYFIISRLPALLGRKIATQYITSLAPKIGDYELNESLCKEMLGYVLSVRGGHEISLTTDQLINEHTGDWETLKNLEKEMIAYNTSFLADGEALNLSNIYNQILDQLILSMSTDSPE